MKTIELLNIDEINTLINQDETVVIKFYKDSCNPCKMLTASLNKLAEDDKLPEEFTVYQAKLETIGEDEFSSLGILGVPRILGFKNKERVADIQGFLPPVAVLAKLDAVLDAVEITDEFVESLEEAVEGDETVDMVNHPPHYNQYSIEVLDLINEVSGRFSDGYHAYVIGNVLKYVLRAAFKNKTEDINKAKFYADSARKYAFKFGIDIDITAIEAFYNEEHVELLENQLKYAGQVRSIRAIDNCILTIEQFIDDLEDMTYAEPDDCEYGVIAENVLFALQLALANSTTYTLSYSEGLTLLTVLANMVL